MLDDRASPSSPAFLACMLQMPITFFPLVPTPQTAIITQKEMDDVILAKKLRQKKRITTPGKPFETSQQAEIEGLIENGVFRVKKYDFIRYNGIHIFKSRIINEIKSKSTNSPYEKLRMIIQNYSNNGEKMVLTQSSMLDSKGYHNPVITIGCLYVRTVWGCESILN
jgi:hypothetical protein